MFFKFRKKIYFYLIYLLQLTETVFISESFRLVSGEQQKNEALLWLRFFFGFMVIGRYCMRFLGNALFGFFTPSSTPFCSDFTCFQLILANFSIYLPSKSSIVLSIASATAWGVTLAAGRPRSTKVLVSGVHTAVCVLLSASVYVGSTIFVCWAAQATCQWVCILFVCILQVQCGRSVSLRICWLSAHESQPKNETYIVIYDIYMIYMIWRLCRYEDFQKKCLRVGTPK